MKAKVILILTTLFLTITLGYAENPQNDLQQIIKSKVSYPVSAIEKNVNGAVFVEFIVNDEGSLEVINCFSLEGELQSYVFNTLSAIKVTPDTEIIGKTYTMRIDFKLI